MKTWLAKFRVSNSYDNGLGPGGSVTAKLACTQAQEFQAQVAELDRSLRGGPRPGQPPLGLHQSIMAAIGDPRQVRVPPNHAHRWIAAGACLSVAILVLWGVVHSTMSHLAPSPFRLSPKLNREVAALPSAAMAPLSTELDSINLDLKKTTQFLLSSIP